MSEQASPNAVYHIICFAFPGRDRAQEVAKDMKRAAKGTNYKVAASAVVEVDDKGKSHVYEGGHGGIGAGAGLVAGGLLGLIGGPAGLLVWAIGGAVIGGVAGHYAGRAIPAEDMRALGQQLPPNSSALLFIVQDKDAEKMLDEMKEYDGQIVTLTVGDQASGEIQQYVSANIVETPQEAAGEAAAAADADKAASAAAAAPAAEAAAADKPAEGGEDAAKSA
ncbi:MAG: DUF1269 domain-containing protein [Anaerolineae bacterium]